jgi:virulence factor Mce-like protein
MIRRLIGALVVVLIVGGIVFLLLRGGGDEKPTYAIVLDNAFGLIEGADVKAAGVKVGKIKSLTVQRRTNRALVKAEMLKPEFADFKRSATCSVEPQSLIGEYFLNCQPGTTGGTLSTDGGVIPVEQTSGTIGPDLVNNVMRLPWRQRFSIILSELGAGFASRGPELQETIKRALPALQETDKVLRILANNRTVLRELTANGDRVMTRLSRNRNNVARFVSEARDTARASAERRTDIAENIRLLPRFLRELRPVLRDLGTTAERQTPALRDLRRAAPDLELLLRRLGPFSQASTPAIRSLGEAAETGLTAIPPARETVKEASELARTGLEPMRNLRFVLEHLNNRDKAIERNRLSPGGVGFTGLEAVLQYIFVQSQAINVFDTRGYNLKLNALISPCGAYRTAEGLKDEKPETLKQCSAALGPGPAPGIDYELDDSKSVNTRSFRRAQDRREVAAPAAEQAQPSSAAAGPAAQSKAALADYLLGP